mmetsp:Transcript_34752/g.75862  ORF Transcript_34752/g.75862 Transcript_34752/m.75862 type:complete len:397 (-) Transcript_34752:737-1927(-)
MGCRCGGLLHGSPSPRGKIRGTRCEVFQRLRGAPQALELQAQGRLLLLEAHHLLCAPRLQRGVLRDLLLHFRLHPLAPNSLEAAFLLRSRQLSHQGRLLVLQPRHVVQGRHTFCANVGTLGALLLQLSLQQLAAAHLAHALLLRVGQVRRGLQQLLVQLNVVGLHPGRFGGRSLVGTLRSLSCGYPLGLDSGLLLLQPCHIRVPPILLGEHVRGGLLQKRFCVAQLRLGPLLVFDHEVALLEQVVALPLQVLHLLPEICLHHHRGRVSHLQVDLGAIPHQLRTLAELQGGASLLAVGLERRAVDDEARLRAAAERLGEEPCEHGVAVGHHLPALVAACQALDHQGQLREGLVDLASLPALVARRAHRRAGLAGLGAEPFRGHGALQALAARQVHEV